MRTKTSKARRIVGAALGSLMAVALVGALPAGPAAADTLTVTRTPWEMYITPSPHGSVGFSRSTHGHPDFYQFASVPPVGAALWQAAPDGEVIGFDGRVSGFGGGGASRLRPFPCLASVDYTYFQTFVDVPAGVTVNQFSVTFNGIDDGARISIYNSANPGGLVVAGSYVFLGGSGTTDLASHMVAGTNRVVITQLDDCAVGNNLSEARIVVNNTVVVSNTAPSVAVTGVTHGASYEIGTVPAAGCAATDAEDGPSSPTPVLSPDPGLGSQTVTCSVTDAGGLSAGASATYSIVDTTDPSIVAAATSDPNGNGWYAGDVTVAFTCEDVSPGAGLAPGACPANEVLTGEGPAVSSTAVTVTDLAGNESAPSNVVTVAIDRTKPTVTAAVTSDPNDAGWYDGDVTVTFTCSDGDGSGLDGDCPDDQVLTGEGAGLESTSVTVTDLAGNESDPSGVVVVNIDRTDPDVAFSGATSYGLLDTVSITCSAGDDLSGIAEATCPSASGPAWSFDPGAHDLEATATDNAGNSASASTSFEVTATSGSLCGLVRAFTDHNGTRTSLCAHLTNFERSRSRGQTGPAAVQLEAFRKEATSRSGKQLTAAQVAVLVGWANTL